MSSKLKCWEEFDCKEQDCPAFIKKSVKCWLESHTHCNKEIQGSFLDKRELCLQCKVFKANVDRPALVATFELLSGQINDLRKDYDDIGLDLAIGLSKTYEMVRKLRLGDPNARLSLDVNDPLLIKLADELNLLGDSIALMVEESHELAMGLCEHYNTLNKLAAGDFSIRASETSNNELIAKLGTLINKEAATLVGLIEFLQRTDEELKTAYQKLQDIIEFLPDAIFVIDKQKKVIAWNKAIEEMTGVKKEDILGKGDQAYAIAIYGKKKQLLVDFLDTQNDLAERKYSYFEQVGTTLYAETFFPARGANEERFVWLTAAPLFDRNGDQVGAIECISDITKRKEIEKALKASEEKYRSLIDNIPDVVWTVNEKGDPFFISSNVQEVFKYTSQEICQDSSDLWFGRIHPEDKDKVTSAYNALFTKGTAFDVEYRFHRKDGQWVWLRSRAVSTYEKDGLNLADGLARDITARKQSEIALNEAHEKLRISVSELEQRNQESQLLREMGEMLRSCDSFEEAYAIIKQFVQQLFPSHSGGLFILNNSKNLLEAAGTWGDYNEHLFVAPEDCWALRLGRVHFVDNSKSGLLCKHVSHPLEDSYLLCVPMTGQGEMLGMLHLRAALHGLTLSGLLKSHFIASNQRLALTVAEHISLALSNLKLHETLKNQAVRDPLTGLFNRRYLEETLEREIHKVARTGTSVGIIMIDIDHFKRFNDTYGHDAGDTVLRELGSLLKEKVRAEDIACRYGGEEFTLILPDATEEVTKERAEELRNAFKQLTTVRRNNISLSCGVALFPKHGITGDTILKAADEALYRAKAAGRNQVLVADKILIS